MPQKPDEEIFDVVDEKDRVVGRAARREVHQNSWFHRSVHIFVFNAKNELFLQKRSEAKDENPGLWDSSVSGHVDSGEDYVTCAHREMREELGIAGDLKFLFKLGAGPETLMEHVSVFTCRTDKTPVCHPDEISEGRFWTIEEIHKTKNGNPGLFTSSFRIILSGFLEKNMI